MAYKTPVQRTQNPRVSLKEGTSLKDWYVDVAEGKVSGWTKNHKFGRNAVIGTTYTPISIGGIYRTPQVSAATKLRVKAGNTNDTANGSGARSIFIQGLNASGAEVSEILPTAGVSAGANSTNDYIRLYRAYVYTSGTYATAATGSHAAAIVIENSAGTEDWLTIGATDFSKGQSQCAIVSIPAGKQAFVKGFFATINSTKLGDILFVQRNNILQTAAPYDALRIILEHNGIDLNYSFRSDIPLGPYVGPCDIGFMGKVSLTTGIMSVDFEYVIGDV